MAASSRADPRRTVGQHLPAAIAQDLRLPAHQAYAPS